MHREILPAIRGPGVLRHSALDVPLRPLDLEAARFELGAIDPLKLVELASIAQADPSRLGRAERFAQELVDRWAGHDGEPARHPLAQAAEGEKPRALPTYFRA